MIPSGMASNKMKTSFVLAISIVLIELSLVCAIQREATPKQTLNNSTQQAAATAERKHSIKDANQRDSLETAPTITSVHHQVWTSSSSGRLDELSPELIGKLRQDVPFLAAYALRPRLVGQQPQSSTLLDGEQLEQPAAASKSYETLVVNNADGAAPARNSGAGPLLVGASAPQASRQSVAPSSSRLGDFSEFKVETSSLSKSEHHHKRSTSLKRPNKLKVAAGKRPARARTGRKSREDSLSQLVRRVKRRRSSAVSKRRASGRRASGGRGKKSRRRRGRRGGSKRGSRRRPTGFKRSRSARFLQDPKTETNELDGEPDRSGVKGGGDVKGASGQKKTPFFASGLKPKVEQADDSASRAGENTDRSLEPDEMKEAVGASDQDNSDDLDDKTDDFEEEEPKRVGDDDVEEDGDTVLVEPKSDGVDDDPELPAAEEDEAGGMGDKDDVDDRDNSVNTIERPEEGAVATVTPSQGDARGNRVNRQRPNELPSNGGGGGGQDQVVGGGIGTTTGSGGTTSDEQDGNKSGTGASATPGVEFADDNEGNRASSGNDGDGSRDESDNRKELPSGLDGADEQAGDSDRDGNFGERTRNGQESDSPRSPDDDGVKRDHPDDDLDLDYRDESERSGEKPSTTSGRDESKDDGRQSTGVNASHPHPKATGEHCDEGSHDHHHDHHHDHNHHDTIDWLRGAIPGEPNDDYPILSRANATDFSCADQKFPGYYADVEARCQIFHICQADGRQDSFL